jgi:hypothetical protein
VTLRDQDGRPWRADGNWYDPAQVEPGVKVLLHHSGCPVAEPPVATEPAEALVPDLRHRLAADPLRRWTLDEIADGAMLSSRTLQRRLTEQGLSLSRLVAEARLQVAAGHPGRDTRPKPRRNRIPCRVFRPGAFHPCLRERRGNLAAGAIGRRSPIRHHSLCDARGFACSWAFTRLGVRPSRMVC